MTHEPPPPLVDAAALGERQEASRQRVLDLQRRAAAARESLAGQRATATSPDRAVTVTVGPAGTLLDLTLSPTASRLPPAALARTVLATYRSATAEAVARTQSVMRDLLGENAAALEAVARAAADEPGGGPA